MQKDENVPRHLHNHRKITYKPIYFTPAESTVPKYLAPPHTPVPSSEHRTDSSTHPPTFPRQKLTNLARAIPVA